MAGVGLIVGAGALLITSLRGEENEPAGLAGAASVERPAASLPDETERPAAPANHTNAPEPASEAQLPRPETHILDAPSGLVVTPQQTGGAAPLPANAQDSEVVFIVRLKGEPDVDTIAQTFKRDRPTAEEAFARLSEKRPELGDFTLVGASFSGEIRLSYRMPPGQAATPAAIDAIKTRLLAIEGVAYADPDYVAHPGKDSPR